MPRRVRPSSSTSSCRSVAACTSSAACASFVNDAQNLYRVAAELFYDVAKDLAGFGLGDSLLVKGKLEAECELLAVLAEGWARHAGDTVQGVGEEINR